MSVSPQVMMLSRAADQRQTILSTIEPFLNKIDVIYGNDILTATYIEPEVTAGGVILPDRRVGESVYQAKIGLVLAFGVDAFKYRDGYAFFSRGKDEDDEIYERRVSQLMPKFGDWVVYRPIGGTFKCSIAGIACQFVRDSEVRGRVSDPDAIF